MSSTEKMKFIRLIEGSDLSISDFTSVRAARVSRAAGEWES